LRHSAATHAHACGVSRDRIKRLTAHADDTMNREVYIQEAAGDALMIARVRGIID